MVSLSIFPTQCNKKEFLQKFSRFSVFASIRICYGVITSSDVDALVRISDIRCFRVQLKLVVTSSDVDALVRISDIRCFRVQLKLVVTLLSIATEVKWHETIVSGLQCTVRYVQKFVSSESGIVAWW